MKRIQTCLMGIWLVVMMFMMMACSSGASDNKPSGTTHEYNGPEDQYATVLVEYKIQGITHRRTWVEKMAVDGHEYLLFGGGIDTSPTVIHSENCPCTDK